MRKLLPISAALLLALIQQVDAQDIPFNGVITDIHNTPAKRARVFTNNKSNYALTNKHGEFGLTNVAPTDTIYIKYQNKYYTIPVNGMQSMRIRLADQSVASVEADEQLQNMGYGYVKKRERTDSNTSITGAELVRTGRYDLVEALQGLVPGLTITKGEFGAGAKANIRGATSISGPTEALYIVDGVIVETLFGINVHAVDRVEVLKDANMYGARGGNGAIIVYTKQGGKSN